MKKTAKRYTKFQLFLKKLIPSFIITFIVLWPITAFEEYQKASFKYYTYTGKYDVHLFDIIILFIRIVKGAFIYDGKISYHTFIALKHSVILYLNGIFTFPGVIEIAILMTLIIALIWSSKKYSELKVHYDTEDFRKELTSTMAHDLKTPLMAASCFAENLLNGTNPDKNPHYAEGILENIRHMDTIISDVLELSKLESDSDILNRTLVSLNSIAANIIKKYEDNAGERNLTFNISGDAEIKADEVLIKRAFENLITNAVKYAEEGTEIKLSISESRFTVENRFSEADITDTNELIKPFVKGDRSRSSKNGSGLGLSIVKNICDMHGYGFKVKISDGVFTAETALKNKFAVCRKRGKIQ